ncbi:MAG: acetyl esterase [Frankiales bacterium]|nr:acetyl esterase [Frankiales bacterium]
MTYDEHAAGLDPIVRDVLDRMIALGIPRMEDVGPVGAREQFRRLVAARLVGTEPPVVGSVETRVIDGPGGQLRLRIATPVGGGPWPLVVHLHGGGWTVGDIDSYDNTIRRLCRDVDAVVVSVDYRLAPEHPWPAGLDDAWAGLLWAVDSADALGADSRVGITGDSAGAQLAASCTLRARDRGGPAITAQLLVVPSTTMVRLWPSYEDSGMGYGLDVPLMAWYGDNYVPDPDRRAGPETSPLEADSHADLPPAVIAVATHDPLRDQGLAYADALQVAGVPVQLVVAEGQIHTFVGMAAIAPAAERAVGEAYAGFRRLLHPH